MLDVWYHNIWDKFVTNYVVCIDFIEEVDGWEALFFKLPYSLKFWDLRFNRLSQKSASLTGAAAWRMVDVLSNNLYFSLRDPAIAPVQHSIHFLYVKRSKSETSFDVFFTLFPYVNQLSRNVLPKLSLKKTAFYANYVRISHTRVSIQQ